MFSPLFWQALVFSATALWLIFGTAWWLYRSQVRGARPAAAMPSERFTATLAILIGAAMVAQNTGAYWDGSKHILTGVVPGGSDFLWPPHLMIYGSFLAMLLIGLASLALIAAPFWSKGQRDPRVWVRSNPYIGLIMLASAYGIGSVPGDAIWHELFGFDLTAWSPPHVLISLAGQVLIVSAAALVAVRRQAVPGRRWLDFAGPLLLSVQLASWGIISVVEWEFGLNAPFVSGRPAWLYPELSALGALFTLALVRRLFPTRFSATLTAVGFHGLRLAINGAMAATGNVTTSGPVLLLLGALIIDLVPWERFAQDLVRDFAQSAGFMAAVMLPAYLWLSRAATFRVADLAIGLAVGLLLGPMMLAGARWFATTLTALHGMGAAAPAEAQAAPASR